ncbi:MAG: C25 family cysteine peptidase [Thermoplasmatota archaeon]
MSSKRHSKISSTSVVLVMLLSTIVLVSFDGQKIEGSLPFVPTRTAGDTDYLIITSSELLPYFQPLAGWRSQMGLKAEIHTVEDSLESSGRDPAEKLFNYISSVYQETDGGLRYLLLGGDSDIVPTRYLHANASKFGLDDHYLSDLYYSSPLLEWDSDDDGIFGEREDIESIGVENISFPLVVGRAPVRTANEAELFVQRTIGYETDPPEGDWFERGIISSSLMDTPNRIDDPITPEDEGYNAYKDNGYKAVENYTLAYIPRSLDIISAHDYTLYRGGSYSGSNDTLKEDTLPTLLSNGSAFFTFAGQSFYDVEYPVSPLLAYSLAHWFDDSGTATPSSLGFQPALTYQDTFNLTNGGKLPVVYISSCDSANFSDPGDRDLENLLYAPEGGAICLIGSTGISWRGEGEDYSLGNWYLMSRFWQNYMSSNRPGDSLFELKEQYLDQKWDEIASKEPLLVGLYTYNYLGDPALRSWVGSPRNFQVHLPSLEVFAGGDSLELEVRDILGTPVAGATVSIYKEDESAVHVSATGPDGKVSAWSDFSSGGSAKLTITHRNYLPYITNITVLDEPANVRIDPSSIEYSPSNPSESLPLNVTVTVENSGGRDLDGLSIALFSEEVTDLRGDLPEALDLAELDLERGSSTKVVLSADPVRSWKRLWVAALPPDDEVNLGDNIASIEIRVNARPRFLPYPYLELSEDPEGPVIFDLEPGVFDPDGNVLYFELLEGSPEWITLNTNGTLVVRPPQNYTGIVSIKVRVTDGLAQDTTSVDILVSSENDPPALIDLLPGYRAIVDTPFSLRLNIIDAEGDDVSVQVLGGPAQFKPAGDIIRFVPYEEDIGNYSVRIIVTDSLGANRTYLVDLEILGPSERLYFTEPSMHLPAARVGSRYSHRIGIDGDLAENAVFSVNSTLIGIDPETGALSFTPGDGDKGTHWIKVTVTSGDVSISRSFILEVEEERSVPSWIVWGLMIGIIALVVVIVGLYLWSGPRLEQYGLEE